MGALFDTGTRNNRLGPPRRLLITPRVADWRRALRTVAGVDGWLLRRIFWISKALAPLTCGQAIDVPDRSVVPVSLRWLAARIDTPGA